jgi:FtsJ-like methyltransferase
MVKKSVYHFFGDYTEEVTYDQQKLSELFSINDTIHEELVRKKDAITAYHKNKKWDRYKKLTNDYELVFTVTQGCPSIALYNPISRSYFKLWEVLNDFPHLLPNNGPEGSPIRAAFLADAPGGFVEAFLNFRKPNKPIDTKDQLFAISMKPTNKIIPDWKFNTATCLQHNLKLCYGKNGTGNLYDVGVINDFVEEVGQNKCDFITADGGFDFSSDFNNQEDMSTHLILSEIYTAINAQKIGGCFILKIFDIHSKTTMKYIYLLKTFYDDVYVTKPLSSRPANSEKYLICSNFKGVHTELCYKYLDGLRVDLDCYRPSRLLSYVDLPCEFVADIVAYNKNYILNQIIHISKTLSWIDNVNPNHIQCIIKEQIRKAIKWCFKYHIKISPEAIKKYRVYFAEPGSLLSTIGLT